MTTLWRGAVWPGDPPSGWRRVRDFQDCAETYPGAAWPEQAMRSLRGLIRAWHAAREQGLAAISAAGQVGDQGLRPLDRDVLEDRQVDRHR
jgi:hypothetical protein